MLLMYWGYTYNVPEEDLLFVWFMVIDSFCNISVMNYTNMLEYLYIYKILEQTHFWQPYGYV